MRLMQCAFLLCFLIGAGQAFVVSSAVIKDKVEYAPSKPEAIFEQLYESDDSASSSKDYTTEYTLSQDTIQTETTSSEFTTQDISTETPSTEVPTTAETTTQDSSSYTDPYCGCALDEKFGMPVDWEPTQIWVDIVIILDTSEAMGEVALIDASTLIESFFGTDSDPVLNTLTRSTFYTRVGLIAMSDHAEVLYNLNLTESDIVSNKVHIKKGVAEINVVEAFNAALTMFNDGLKAQPDRENTRQVIYYMTDSDPKIDMSPLNEFKASYGVIIVNNFVENGIERPGLKELASDGYYYSDIQDNYMQSIQLFCKANCFCLPGKDPYRGQTTDLAVRASGGCFHPSPVGVQYSKAKTNCVNLGGGLIASIHDADMAYFVQQLMSTAAPKSSYFWIGYSKTDYDWEWEDQSSNPYTNWDKDEPSPAAVSKCAYIDVTSAELPWGAGNCNVGFPSVCEFAPCSVGNKNC